MICIIKRKCGWVGMSFKRTDLRIAVIHLVCKWDSDTDMSDDSYGRARWQICKLLGCDNWEQLKERHKNETDGIINTHLEMLKGPHGYTYFKMLKARRE